MDEACDICGHIGYEEVIATCSKCNIAREHVYCMQVYVREVPEVWVCEECLQCNDLVLPKSGGKEGCFDLGTQSHCKRHKAVETGKVKFLSTDEVIRLSSGAPKNGSPSRRNFGLKHGPSNSMASKTVTSKFSRPMVKANRSVVSSGLLLLKPPRHDDAQRSSIMHCQPIINAEERVLSTPIKDHVGKEQPVEALIPTKEVGTSITETKKAMNKISCTPSPSRLSTPNISLGQNFHSVAELKNSDVEEREQLYIQYLPAPHATWKGGFKFSDTATPVDFYGGFQAQPPCRVHRKAYEFSQKMPIILQVKLLPRCNLWTDLFQNACPDFHDIALYFFPANNIERSKQNYACLFELMEIQNSVMISYIDGVELLIFTSKHLHVDSQDVITRLNTKSFLWGVFRSAKNDQCTHDCDSYMDESEAIDMEIDMVGGRIVGIVDKVISNDSSVGVCGTSEKDIVDEITLQKSDGKVSTVTQGLGSTIKQLLLDFKRDECNVSEFVDKLTQKTKSKSAFELLLQKSPGKSPNAMDEMDIPPGFEKMSRENIDLLGVSGRDFGACSLQPQRSVEDSNLQGILKHQEPARFLENDPLAADPSPLSEKEIRSELKIEVEGNDDQKPIEVGEKKKIGTPFCSEGTSQSTTGSFNSEVSARDKNGYLQAVEIKAKVKKFKYERDDFSHKLHTKSPSKIEVPVRWTPPPTDWVKLNTEGCSKGNPGAARAGGVIRDESGKWVLGYTLSLGTCKSLAADFWALYQGLQLVWDRGFKKVQVETVSSEVVEYLKKAPSSFDPNRAIVECCRALLKRDWNCEVYHIQKEANLCSNWLATHFEDHNGLTILKSPPPKLVPYLLNDCKVVVQPLTCQPGVELTPSDIQLKV